MLYHLVWLSYDLTHWHGPWTLFGIALSVWAMWRGWRWHRRQRLQTWIRRRNP
jgi:hypothetical protein